LDKALVAGADFFDRVLTDLEIVAAMRKQLKKKRRSCPTCKPHKMAKCNRWKLKEHDALLRFDREARQLMGRVAA